MRIGNEFYPSDAIAGSEWSARPRQWPGHNGVISLGWRGGSDRLAAI